LSLIGCGAFWWLSRNVQVAVEECTICWSQCVFPQHLQHLNHKVSDSHGEETRLGTFSAKHLFLAVLPIPRTHGRSNRLKIPPAPVQTSIGTWTVCICLEAGHLAMNLHLSGLS